MALFSAACRNETVGVDTGAAREAWTTATRGCSERTNHYFYADELTENNRRIEHFDFTRT